MIRPLAIRDFPLFNRYRKNGLYLYNIPMLTWGPGVVSAGAMFSSFSSLTGVFTIIMDEGIKASMIAQVAHHQGSPFAHLTFLAPLEQVDSKELPALLDQVVTRVSARGAHSIIAEAEESGPAFEALRKAGFSIYTRQRIWRLAQGKKEKNSIFQWQPLEDSDSIAVKTLCGSLLPGMIQQMEPTPWDRLRGMVFYEQGELRAYVDLRKGPRGIWMQPFVHIDAQSVNQSFGQLVRQLRPNPKRPLYVCVRSYQDQFESLLLEMEAEKGPRQAVMVKRTDVRVKTKRRQAIIERNGRRTEPSAPISVPSQRVALEME